MKINFAFLFLITGIVASRDMAFTGGTEELDPISKYNAQNNEKANVSFLLFTRRNPLKPDEIILDNEESVENSEFNPQNPSRFLIHGWRGGPSDVINVLCQANYLARGDYNIFIVDWCPLASSSYLNATVNVREAGKQVAAFIDFLHRNHGLNLASTYIIGHSLGAHVAGITGKHVKRGRIRAIFGLDPAQPLFSIDRPNERLDANDAEYVENIHTNTAFKGFAKPIGDSSYYPNWGRRQPGCGADLLGSCSHERAVRYFAESLEGKSNFYGVQCESYGNIENMTCNIGVTVKMGGDLLDFKGSGVFYVPVGEKYPFAKGKIPYMHLFS